MVPQLHRNTYRNSLSHSKCLFKYLPINLFIYILNHLFQSQCFWKPQKNNTCWSILRQSIPIPHWKLPRRCRSRICLRQVQMYTISITDMEGINCFWNNQNSWQLSIANMLCNWSYAKQAICNMISAIWFNSTELCRRLGVILNQDITCYQLNINRSHLCSGEGLLHRHFILLKPKVVCCGAKL